MSTREKIKGVSIKWKLIVPVIAVMLFVGVANTTWMGNGAFR